MEEGGVLIGQGKEGTQSKRRQGGSGQLCPSSPTTALPVPVMGGVCTAEPFLGVEGLREGALHLDKGL